jgi:hypothetical protein
VIITELGIALNRVLFIDDRQDNVDAAREAGLLSAVFRLESGISELHRILKMFEIHIV